MATVNSDVIARINQTGLGLIQMTMLNESLRQWMLQQQMDKQTPQLFPTSYRIAATVLHSTIFLLGFWGNILLLVVVHRTRSLHVPTYCYLVSLACADLVALVSAVPEAVVSYHLYGRQWVLGQPGCSLLIFGNFLGINAGSLSITAFSVERYVVICHPLLAKKICSVQRAKKIICILWIGCILYSAPWLGLTKVQPHPTYAGIDTCDLRLSRRTYMVLFIGDICLFYVIPLIAAMIFYFKITSVLKARSKEMSEGRRCGSIRRPSMVSMGSGGSFVVKRSNPALYRDSSTRMSSGDVARRYSNPDQSHAQVTKMLAIVVVAFAISWLPYRGLLVYNTFTEKPWLNIWFMLFAKSLIFINCSMNPFLYNAMSKRFRMAFIRIICCRHRGSGRLRRQSRLKKRGQSYTPPRKSSLVPSL
ncbi:thyrotropin-releasing hormone receptor-like [Paramacrobiotus metropolitanus]|uniref:thyrotropin-releasing hormone receptor-like n=1 Tax=Paramacrobiotus metropolitanus TaxID=2943436 RepID=UPI0024456B9B|nr:thyrotropin-releasing hormone receptor-like [Paramacrobiotus metropolitanus]